MVTVRRSKRLIAVRLLGAISPSKEIFTMSTLKIRNIYVFYFLFFGPLIFFLSFYYFLSLLSVYVSFSSSILRVILFFPFYCLCLSFLHSFTPVIQISSAPHKLTFNCHFLCVIPVQAHLSCPVDWCNPQHSRPFRVIFSAYVTSTSHLLPVEHKSF